MSGKSCCKERQLQVNTHPSHPEWVRQMYRDSIQGLRLSSQSDHQSEDVMQCSCVTECRANADMLEEIYQQTVDLCQ